MIYFKKFFYKLVACICILILLDSCSTTSRRSKKLTFAPKAATSRPYRIRGRKYVPQQYYEYNKVGTASHYGQGDIFHGRLTATGDRFDRNKITAAHRTLPLPCVVLVTNLKNGRSLKVLVNDRGPYVKTNYRIIDLSAKAAKLLGFFKNGTAKVRVQTLVQDSIRLRKNRRSYKSSPTIFKASFLKRSKKNKYVVFDRSKSKKIKPNFIKKTVASFSPRPKSRLKKVFIPVPSFSPNLK